MISTHLTALLLATAACGVAAQTPDHTADHTADHVALRQLKANVEQALSQRDFMAMQHAVHQPFMVTVVTQNSFTDIGTLKTYFDGLFTHNQPRLKNYTIKAEADELSQIMTGTFALTRGATAERYELTDGRAFDMKGRWTAVSVKESDGHWKLLGIHTGVNFLDNPVLTAIEKSVLWTGLGALALGLLVGLTGGWFMGRARARR